MKAQPSIILECDPTNRNRNPASYVPISGKFNEKWRLSAWQKSAQRSPPHAGKAVLMRSVKWKVRCSRTHQKWQTPVSTVPEGVAGAALPGNRCGRGCPFPPEVPSIWTFTEGRRAESRGWHGPCAFSGGKSNRICCTRRGLLSGGDQYRSRPWLIRRIIFSHFW